MPLLKPIGRPPIHSEAYTKATVVLLNRQIVYLDHLCADIRAANGAVVKRAEIIRALIDALSECGEDLRGVRTEADLKKLLLRDRMASAKDLDDEAGEAIQSGEGNETEASEFEEAEGQAAIR
jgi:hypothetical protein